MKTQATNHISDKILITRIFKEILQLNKTAQFFKIGNSWTEISPKKAYKDGQ